VALSTTGTCVLKMKIDAVLVFLNERFGGGSGEPVLLGASITI
jgi:hypothetical protein